MIPPIPELKKTLRVTGSILVVAPMDSRGQRFQLSTVGSGGRVVGTAFTRADAEALAMLWRWGQGLLEEVERLRMAANKSSADWAAAATRAHALDQGWVAPKVETAKKGRRDAHRID